MDYVSLAHEADKPVKTFSKGMKQRLGLAKALIHDPEILIMDEPHSGLDLEGIELLRRLILRLAKEGKTVLFSSHQLNEILHLCTSIGVISRGRLIYQGSLNKFFDCNNRRYNKYQISFNSMVDHSSIIDLENLEIIERATDSLICISDCSEQNLREMFRGGNFQVKRLQPSKEELLLHYYYRTDREESLQVTG